MVEAVTMPSEGPARRGRVCAAIRKRLQNLVILVNLDPEHWAQGPQFPDEESRMQFIKKVAWTETFQFAVDFLFVGYLLFSVYVPITHYWPKVAQSASHSTNT